MENQKKYCQKLAKNDKKKPTPWKKQNPMETKTNGVEKFKNSNSVWKNQTQTHLKNQKTLFFFLKKILKQK